MQTHWPHPIYLLFKALPCLYISLWLTIFAQPAKAIQGGKLTEGRFPSVVAYEINEFTQFNLCSAVVVHPRVLLTVGHCKRDMEKLSTIKISKEHYKVKTLVHPLLPVDFWLKPLKPLARYDVMMMVLDKPIDSYNQPAAIAVMPAAPNIEHVQLVGYGPHQKHDPTSVSKAVTQVGRRFTNVKLNIFDNFPGIAFADHSKERKSVCVGDSGGGIFIDEKLVGLISLRDRYPVGFKPKKKAKNKTPDEVRFGCQAGVFNTVIVNLADHLQAIERVIMAVEQGQEISAKEAWQ